MGLNTRAAELLLDGEATALTRKPIELALVGDPTAMRFCLERILPPSRERTLSARRGCHARAAAGMYGVRPGGYFSQPPRVKPAMTVLSRLDVRAIKKYTSALSGG